MTLLVEHPGPLSLIQDRGRPGMGHAGVSPSGAFDRGALRQANLLLGNSIDAPVIETFGDLDLRAGSAHVIAVTGGAGPIRIDDRPVAYGRAVQIAPGQRLRIGPPAIGLRTYLGVSGGFSTSLELGSASTDTLSGLGPAPLLAGDVLRPSARRRVPDLEDVPSLQRSGDIGVAVMMGPREDWFTPTSQRQLLEVAWSMSAASNRVGMRLDGPPMQRLITRELPSEPVVRGSIQIAADGQPMIFGPDYPVTGGYPVIAVVIDRDTDRLAQARPGQVIRFGRA